MKSLDYPPYHNLIKIFDNCPAAIFVYVMLWRNHINGEVQVKRSEVEDKYLTDQSIFSEYLFFLNQLDLLKFSQIKEHFYITLDDCSFSAKGYALC